VGMSKSGLFAHFGSKQELQIATIQAARDVFAAQVIDPALAARTGVERVRQLVENFLRYVEGGLYPGGCFFASVAAEMAMRPGPVRDGAVQVLDEFSRQLEAAVRQAQAEGAIDPAEDAEQLAFELDAYLSLANAQFALSQESDPIDRARGAVEDRIKAAAPAA
jgi:AcrR family transcriptional regulator